MFVGSNARRRVAAVEDRYGAAFAQEAARIGGTRARASVERTTGRASGALLQACEGTARKETGERRAPLWPGVHGVHRGPSRLLVRRGRRHCAGGRLARWPWGGRVVAATGGRRLSGVQDLLARPCGRGCRAGGLSGHGMRRRLACAAGADLRRLAGGDGCPVAGAVNLRRRAARERGGRQRRRLLRAGVDGQLHHVAWMRRSAGGVDLITQHDGPAETSLAEWGKSKSAAPSGCTQIQISRLFFAANFSLCRLKRAERRRSGGARSVTTLGDEASTRS
jgi:hypothetical protein